MAAAIRVRLKVQGMDCPSCALKIENVMRRLPGVSDVAVSYENATLTLRIRDAAITTRTIQESLRALGYGSTSHEAVPSIFHDHKPAAWWQDTKSRHALISGSLLVIAVICALTWPRERFWAFTVGAIIAITPFARRAVAGARQGSPFTIETLMSTAVLGAVAIGEAEEALVVIVLFAVGEWLESVAAVRARKGIESLIKVMPRQAIRVLPSGATETVLIDALAINDRVLVRPGDRIPSDGVILEGESEVNQAPITGESTPILMKPGARVLAGSINLRGELMVRITRTATDNTIARIIHKVEEAQASKAPTARMIDRFSHWYTPSAMAVAALIMVTPPLAAGADWMTWLYRGLATLLIACPCALLISTPAAIASGLASGARQGLLIKGGAALETLGKVKRVAFDKTGTLTRGHPRVTDVVVYAGTEDDVLARAAAAGRQANHPLGFAIAHAASQRGLTIPATDGSVRVIPGRAAIARLNDECISIGSPRYASEVAELTDDMRKRIASLEDECKTVVVLMAAKHAGSTPAARCEGLIALRDELRVDAVAGVTALKHLGLNVVVLSGDNCRAVSAMAVQLGVEAQANLLPNAKLAHIEKLKHDGAVAMVGDGINDAPALAAASVGIAMGGGTNVALDTADAALLRDRVLGVAELVALSRTTLANIRENIALALGLKAVFLCTTLLGVTTLWMAILADTGATVLVTANALRLLAYQPQKHLAIGHRGR